MTEVVTSGSVGGMASNGCLYPEKLIELLALRIDDKAFLRLIRKWLKAGILEPDGAVNYPEKGSA